MANTVNYAQKFERQLKQKYTQGLKSAGLTTANKEIRWVNAKTIQVPYLILQGYKDHGRNGGFNRQDAENRWMPFVLDHDRDVEYFIDTMDVDESNQALEAANLTNTFETDHAIPETDAYRFSKTYAEFIRLGQTADTTAITPANALLLFDNYMEAMDDAEVPEEGRILYVTPTVYKNLKQAEQIARNITVNTNNSGNIQRAVRSLEEVTITKVPSTRMKTSYDFTDGFVPAAGALQINMILVHPRSVIAVDKHSYIKFWPPGTHTVGDGYLYQNRKYGGLFVIDTRVQGVMINTAESTTP